MYRFYVYHPILVELLLVLISANLVTLECQFHVKIMHTHNILCQGLVMTFPGQTHVPSGGQMVYDIHSGFWLHVDGQNSPDEPCSQGYILK